MHLAKYVCMVLLALAMLAQAVPVSAPKGDAATIESAEMSAKIDSLSERVADLLKTTGAKNVVKGHPTPDKLSWKNLKPQEKLLILSMILGVVGNGSFIVSGAIGSHRLMQQQNRINQLNDELKTLKADGLAEPEPKPKPLITLRKRQGQDEVPLLSRTASARSKILNQLNNELSWLNSHPEGGKAAREQALNHIVGEINELRSSHKAFGDALKENEERLLHLAKELGVKIELTAQQTAEGMRPIDVSSHGFRQCLAKDAYI